MEAFRKVFTRSKTSIIGMIHVRALPGTPLHSWPLSKIVDEACKEAEIYKGAQLDGVIVENMFDVPYVKADQLGPEIVSSMTRVCCEVRRVLPSMPCGVQILAGGNKEALGVAKAADFQFIRAEGFVFGHVADEGLIEASAGPLLRYRRQIGAQDILVFSDIKKKHSAHAITSDVSIEETAHAAQFFLSDGVIVTGTATGHPADECQLRSLKSCASLPVLVGSGVSLENVPKYMGADSLIVGSYFKKDGRWDSALCKTRVNAFMEKVEKLRNQL